MLPEVGGSELVLIAIVALIVVGPQDLPVMLRKLGQFVGKLRAMASEFRASFDDMARQSELDELRKEVEAMRKGQFDDQATHDLGAADMSKMFDDIGQSLQSSDVSFYPGGKVQMEPLAEPTTIEIAVPKAKVRKPRKVVETAPAKTPSKRARKPKAGTAA